MKVYRKFRKSTDAAVIVRNTWYLTLLQIAGYVFPLITLPYLARVIGAYGFGKIAFATTIIVWMQTIADWGFMYTATRDVAQNRNDLKKVSDIFSNVFWSRCILIIISFVLLLLLLIVVPIFRENAIIILVSFLSLPGHLCFPDWFFQAMEKMKFITIFTLLIKLLSTICIFLFIRKESDYLLQPLFISLGSIICGLMSFFVIFKEWQIRLAKPKLKSICSTISGSSDVFINNLMPSFYNNLSVILLGAYGGAVANGIYEGGNRIITVINQFFSIITRVFFPFLSRRPEKHTMFAVFNIVIAFLVSFLIYILAPFIIKTVLTNGFIESVNVLRILAVSYFFLVLDTTYGTNYLIVVHEEKLLRNVTICVSLIGLMISWPLIYYYSYIGAALTVCVSRFFMGTLIFFFSLKIKKSKKFY